jgi:hypothetical protein
MSGFAPAFDPDLPLAMGYQLASLPLFHTPAASTSRRFRIVPLPQDPSGV